MKAASKVKRLKVWLILKAAFIFFLIGGSFFILKHRKDALLRECTQLLEYSLSHGTDCRVRIGKVGGRLAGFVSFKDVTVEAPWLPEGEESVFRASEIQFRYDWLDFFTKNPNAKIEVIVTKPVVYWRPRVGLKKQEFPLFSWVRDWAVSQKDRFVVRLKSMTLILGYQKKEFKDIDIDYENRTLRAEIPLTHVKIGASDLSSVVKLEGRFQAGRSAAEDLISGQITTEGTVVNWKPLEEAKLEFDFSSDSFRVDTVTLLGGIDISGQVDPTDDYAIDFTLKAQNYALSNLGPFFGLEKSAASRSRIDTVTRLHGSLWAPAIESRWRIYEGVFGKRSFKAMDVSVEGVYPTVRIADSRILLQDGSSMRIADKTLEVRELFQEKTYERLVSEAEQDTVVWGDWELSRQKGNNDRSEFVMQRNLGENANVHFTKFSEGDKPLESRDSKKMEVGFEYRLRAKDSLKLELRDDEEFIGVERKMKF
ncbi:MAG: hypothetical protein AUJ71_03775 [Candidatus Omnitrophica bacterium CG1_02_49_16]|nr:MAG: hypothetical protein AUJ71_03775 [Candidatus Omnitrophica bacterium CG1_02_49_16]